MVQSGARKLSTLLRYASLDPLGISESLRRLPDRVQGIHEDDRLVSISG